MFCAAPFRSTVKEIVYSTVVDATVAKTVYSTVVDTTVAKTVYSTVVDTTVTKTVYSVVADVTVAKTVYSTVEAVQHSMALMGHGKVVMKSLEHSMEKNYKRLINKNLV